MLYVEQMCENQMRTIVTPITRANQVNMQHPAYRLILQGTGDCKLTQVLPKSIIGLCKTANYNLGIKPSMPPPAALKLTHSIRLSINVSIQLTAFFEVPMPTACSNTHSRLWVFLAKTAALVT